MLITDDERRLLAAVLRSVRDLSYHEQEKLVGSLGAQMVCKMERKLRYYPYCERHGISFEEMTDDDIVNAMMEE